MKKFIAIVVLLFGVLFSNNIMAQGPEGGQRPQRPEMINHSDTPEGKQVLALSTQMWQWMADKDADKLAELYHDSAVFVHMG
ncbi:MAG: nuclear transport factor 2 family protein, partial [Rikenellaceae bacterium]|nr:nuclear transport factor 2 family protein [Rikenellaceae bacterium]